MVYLRRRLALFIRTRRGSMTQREFARRVGVAQSTVMRIENEEQNVTLDTLENFCQALRLEVGDLFPPLPVRRYADGQRPRAPSLASGVIHEAARDDAGASDHLPLPRRRRSGSHGRHPTSRGRAGDKSPASSD